MFDEIALFSLVNFVLVETSHPGNIGAAARALKTMGFSSLHLLFPKDLQIKNKEYAIALASGAQDVLHALQLHESIESALGNSHWIVALSARKREYAPPTLTPRIAAQYIAQRVRQKQTISLIFGSERFGLSNALLEHCHQLVMIPANPAYCSLNLAQAVQLMAYEIRLALCSDSDVAMPSTLLPSVEELATQQEMRQTLMHWQQALLAIKFLNPEHPKKLMPRLTQLLMRQALTKKEVNLLRGLAHRILQIVALKQ